MQVLHKKAGASHEAGADGTASIADLAVVVDTCYPNLRQVEKESISDLLVSINKLEVKPELISELLSGLSQRAFSRSLAIAALEASEGKRTFAEVGRLAKELETLSNNPTTSWKNSRNFVTDDLNTLESHTIKSPGLRWRLDSLNRSLGPIRDGDFGFVFARPESGKTTFLSSETTFFAQQAVRPIVWFNNEEQGEKVRLRTYQASLGLTTDELWQNKQAHLDKYRKLTKGLLYIYDDAAIHKNEVESIIAELGPQLVVFDQIDKIKGFDADRPDLVYGRIYQWARELAKSGCAVIGICQSDGTGEGVKWLTMSHVAEAKTSKQAEADWILGIGRSNESGTENIRFFNISKNKLLGDQHTDPNERHGRFEVYMRPMIARYEDLDE